MARKKIKAPQLDETLNESISIKEGFGNAHGGEEKTHEKPSSTNDEPINEPSKPAEETSNEGDVKEKEQTTDEVSVKDTGFKGKIKPEYDVIKGLIDSINQYYNDEIINLKRFKDFETTRKNWEKQARGACEMIVSKVNSDHFDVNDPYKCSPLAYSKIKNSDSRDLSVLDLAGAVIVFYNSVASETKEFGESYLPFEDFTDKIVKVKDGLYEYAKPCKNQSLLYEGTFARLYNILKNETYAIITAYRKEFTKKENIIRNRKLRGILNNHLMGVYQLIGHWREAPDGVNYVDATEDQLTDAIERSYLVKKPPEMDYETFEGIILDCLTIDGATQDCAIIHKENGIWEGITKDNEKFEIGKNITLNKVAQAYSQWVKKSDMPFVFEFVEKPSSNSGRLVYTKNNINYLV